MNAPWQRERVWREAEDARQRMEDLAAQIAKDEAEQKAHAAEKRRLKEEQMAKRRESMSGSASVSSSELSSDPNSRRPSSMLMFSGPTASPMTAVGSGRHLMGVPFNNSIGEGHEVWDFLEESNSQVMRPLQTAEDAVGCWPHGKQVQMVASKA